MMPVDNRIDLHFDLDDLAGREFDLQQDLLRALQEQMRQDEQIRAGWLEGSFGRGAADRYSDIDLHLWLDAGQVDAWRAQAENWVNELAPTVLFRLLFNGRMINALTQEGLRLDIWLHEGDAPQLRAGAARILYDPEDALHMAAPQPRDAQALAAWLESQIQEFWRCVSLAPSVLGRGERITTFMGLSIMSTLIADICIAGDGIARDSGVKRMNDYLPARIRYQIEDALCLDDCREEGFVQANLALAHIVQTEGPRLAEMHGFVYPQRLEDAVLAYFQKELAYLRL